ncbi:uncharacterized protein LOC108829678 [Raphanus sativus]|uniref:Uncharacterized protein LOC108829678 n=1 Tax=Raphanus sativus TaxID=3726 RepID=A0A6J0LF22_RAPSA|nr:uncharacterized protein LOC108829678 [Raphanus sativus]
MAQEDYHLDMNREVVDFTYTLPEQMMQQKAQDTPHIHVTSDRQVRNLVEICKTHDVRLCVSSRGRMTIVSDATKVADEEGDANEVSDKGEEEYYEDGDEVSGEEEEDAYVPNIAEVDEDDFENYSVYGKVKDEDDNEVKADDISFEGFKTPYASGGGSSNMAFSDNIYVNQIVAKCRVAGCGWKLRAGVKHGSKTFWVTKYLKTHICSVSDRVSQWKHSTPKYVAKLWIDRVGIIDVQNPKHIKDAMKNMCGMELDYTTLYRALLYAQEMVRGSAEDGYERLPSYQEQIKIANPGTITSIELGDKDRFKYLFLAFGASITGFQYQRRVIVVDGTHLSGKYGGVLLFADAQDGNFQIFHLAFAIVDAERLLGMVLHTIEQVYI